MVHDPLVDAVRDWAAKEKAHNPSFALVLGRKSFTIDQIVEHIEKDTLDGRELRKMIFAAATDLFFNYTPPARGRPASR